MRPLHEIKNSAKKAKRFGMLSGHARQLVHHDIPDLVADVKRLGEEHTKNIGLLAESNTAILDLCAEITELKALGANNG